MHVITLKTTIEKKGKPIPIANWLPAINTKALHIIAPETSKKGKGCIYRDHLLDSKIEVFSKKI